MSREAVKPAFGGGETTKCCIALLLGNISNLNRLNPGLQLEEILEWVRFFDDDYLALDGPQASSLWDDEGQDLDPSKPAEVKKLVGDKIASIIALGFLNRAEECHQF